MNHAQLPIDDQETRGTPDHEGKAIVDSSEAADDFDFDDFVASIIPEEVPALNEFGEPIP